MINTKRLLIREFTLSDAKFILELVNTDGWLKFIGDRNVHSIEDAENFIINGPLKSYETYGYGAWIIEDRENQTALGICGFFKRDYLDWPDLGFALLPSFYGKGYMVEAAQACMEYALTYYEYENIYGITSLENNASIRVLEKVGLKFRENIQPESEVLACYSLH